MKVVFCSSEVVPFAKTGGLADVCGALPLALEKTGLEVCIFLPHYPCVQESEYVIEKFNEQLFMTTIGENIKVYFIEHQKFFNREGLYGSSDGDYLDNLDRFQFFCEQVLVSLKALDFSPDIIHCHDWQGTLIPVYLKEKYAKDSFYSNTKSILTIHNLAYQGIFPSEEYKKLGLDQKLFNHEVFEFFEKVNLLKAGIVYADEITTVSPQYSKEIQTKEFGCGLEGFLHAQEMHMEGILNGLDYDVWNPATDVFLEENYTANNFLEKKRVNKIFLQKELNFSIREDVPLLGFVARLSHQKGIDLILEAMDDLVKLDLQIVIQGVGEEKYHTLLNELALRHPKKIAIYLEFSEKMAHQIYAGSDLFLMPSLFEPCGLSQMISLAYGTVPIVFKTGGLADTIDDHNGFMFEKYTKESFVEVIQQAMSVFKDASRFQSFIKKAFASNFCWERSAKAYQKVYECLLSD